MSHATISIQGYPHPAVPRGARLVGLIASIVARGLGRRPSPARARAAEAAAVREMAARMQSTDPSFASDLVAAAMRHESQGDESARS